MRHVRHYLQCVSMAADAVVVELRWTLAWLMKFFGVPPPSTTDAVRGRR